MSTPKPAKASKPKTKPVKGGKAKAVRKVASKVTKADRDATHAVAGARHNPVMKAISLLADVADQPPLIAASLGTFAIGLATGRRDLARGGARMLISHLATTGVKLAIKQQVARTRPGPALDKGRHKFELGEAGEHEETSFPSGHTAGAVAVALAASRDIDGVAAPAAAATAAVAASQAPAGNHYLLDVAAGAAIGWAVEAAVSAVFDRLEPKVEAALSPSPASGRGTGEFSEPG